MKIGSHSGTYARQGSRSASILAAGVASAVLALSIGVGTLAPGVSAVAQEAPATVDSVTLPEQIAAKCLPSVGSVYCLVQEGGYQYTSQGSCEVIDAEEGLLVTNYHVVTGSIQTQVVLGGVTYDAEIVGSDPTSDIAVLRVDPSINTLVPIEIGSSADLRVGQWVMTVGSPKGEAESVSVGIVSGLGRSSSISIDRSTTGYYVGLIQTDAMINSGSSGGALVDAQGRLIGVTTLNMSQTGDFAGMSYAIPIDYVMRVVNQIVEYGSASHPMLGVNVGAINEAYSGGYSYGDSLLYGAYINGLVAGGAAEAAGIQVGDLVIAIDGHDVYSPEDLILGIRNHVPGETATVTLVRGGQTLELEVLLGSDTDVENTVIALPEDTHSLFGGDQINPNPGIEDGFDWNFDWGNGSGSEDDEFSLYDFLLELGGMLGY